MLTGACECGQPAQHQVLLRFRDMQTPVPLDLCPGCYIQFLEDELRIRKATPIATEKDVQLLYALLRRHLHLYRTWPNLSKATRLQRCEEVQDAREALARLARRVGL